MFVNKIQISCTKIKTQNLLKLITIDQSFYYKEYACIFSICVRGLDSWVMNHDVWDMTNTFLQNDLALHRALMVYAESTHQYNA